MFLSTKFLKFHCFLKCQSLLKLCNGKEYIIYFSNPHSLICLFRSMIQNLQLFDVEKTR